MATASSIPEALQSAASPVAPALLISLAPLSPDALYATIANLEIAFAGQNVVVATADGDPNLPATGQLRVVQFTPAAPTSANWVLTPADYINTYKLMQENRAAAGLLLGAEAQTLHPEALQAMAAAVLTGATDLATPDYDLGPRDGLVNSAILYPTTRALFATRPRFPLAIDLAFSSRMADRLAACAQKYTATGQNSALIWPVAEAATVGYSIAEVPGGTRTLPTPDAADLNSLLAQVAGSLFADIDAKASFWQRARVAYSPRSQPAGPTPIVPEPAQASPASETEAPAQAPAVDVQPMLDSFRLAYSNLHEIWSLVLPPNSLLGLKKLSLMPPASFRMPDSLWARIVYDFILAYRLRTINRGHLLGALTPLYLAWVASHLLLTSGAAGLDSMTPEQHVQALAAAFEADKPYLVSRWRWPDRFNP